MKLIRVVLMRLILSISLTSSLMGLDVKGVVGVHDNYVPGRQHHTLSIGVGVYLEHTTQSNIFMSAYFDGFIDDDDEEIDDDRYSQWIQAGFDLHGPVANFSENIDLIWEADGYMRDNTVTSIERIWKGFIGLMPQYHQDKLVLGLGLYGGYYYFEIDDDVPRQIGFPSDELTYESLAYCVKGKLAYEINDQYTFTVVPKQWRDDNDWLQNQVTLALEYDMSAWVKKSEIILNTEYNRYNLSNAEASNGVRLDVFRDEEWNTRLFARISF